MEETLASAYDELEKALTSAMTEHRGNKSLMSVLLNTLLLYPDHPYGFEDIWARAFDPAKKEYYKFLVARPRNLDQNEVYAKEAALIAGIREEIRQGRRCQVYATYTGAKDVNGRLEWILSAAGFRVAVLRASTPTHKREEWYNGQLESGVEVVICLQSWSRRASICSHFRPSTSIKPAIRCIRCDRPAAVRGVSDKGIPYE